MNPIEVVVWRDAHFEFDQPDDWPDDYIVHTVGFVIEEQERFIVIGSEELPDDRGFRQTSRIPRESILAREVLRPVPTVALLSQDQGGTA